MDHVQTCLASNLNRAEVYEVECSEESMHQCLKLSHTVISTVRTTMAMHGIYQRELANGSWPILKLSASTRQIVQHRVQQISCWSVPINPCKFALASKARTLSKEWLNTCPFRLGFITRERLPMYFIVRDQKAMLLKGMVVIGFVQ